MFLLFGAFSRRAKYPTNAAALLALLFAGAVSAAGVSTARAATSPGSPIAQASPTAAPAPDTSPSAEPAPSSSTTPLPGGRGGEAPTAGGGKSPLEGHLPIIDIVPWFTQPLFYTVGPPVKGNANANNPLVNAGVGYDPIDIGGTIKVPLTTWLSFSFDRNIEGTLNVPNARVTTATHAYSYPVFSRDVVLVDRLDEVFHNVQIEEGLYFRHRVVGGSNTSNNPYLPTISSTEAHMGYIGVTYATPSLPSWLLNSFITLNINADTQAVDHHIGCGNAKDFVSGSFKAPCIGGVWDPNPNQNRYWETDQFVQLTVPIGGRHGATFSAQDRWGALNFYENAAFPYRAVSSQTYFVTKRFNRVFALSLRTRSQWYVPQGAPYVKPNTTHNGSVDILADFKLDTNTFVH